ncbi:hypothetical protein ACSSS7_001309 [Eimeria intestinalis]
MGVAVAAGALEAGADVVTAAPFPAGEPLVKWKASSKRRSAWANAALAALIPLVVILVLTMMCFPPTRKTVLRSHATAGRRLAAGDEEGSDEDRQQSELLEACLDLQAEIGFSLQQAFPPDSEDARGQILAFLLDHEKPQEQPAHAAEAFATSAPLQSHEPIEDPSGSMQDFLFSPQFPQLEQLQSPPPSPSSALQTPHVSPSTPSSRRGTHSPFSLEESDLAFGERPPFWKAFESGEKRKLDEFESSAVEERTKKQKRQTSDSSQVQQLFFPWSAAGAELLTEGGHQVSAEPSQDESQTTTREGSFLLSAILAGASATHAAPGTSGGFPAVAHEHGQQFIFPSASTALTSVPLRATPPAPPASAEAPSTSWTATVATPGGTEVALPPPAPPMPRNTHLYYRLPVFIPTPWTTPLRVFDVSRAFALYRMSKLFTEELRMVRALLARETLGTLEAQMLTEACERLVNILIHEHNTNIDDREPRHAAEFIGRRYLAIEALFCAIQVLGPLMHAEAWWPTLVQQIPTAYSREPFFGSRRTAELVRLANRLSEASESLKRGVRPGEEETIKLKRELFKCSPRRFKESAWDPWRESDPEAGAPHGRP